MFIGMLSILFLMYLSHSIINKEERVIINFHDDSIQTIDKLIINLYTVEGLLNELPAQQLTDRTSRSFKMEIELIEMNLSLIRQKRQTFSVVKFERAFSRLEKYLNNFDSFYSTEGREQWLIKKFKPSLASAKQLVLLYHADRKNKIAEIAIKSKQLFNAIYTIVGLILIFAIPIVIRVLKNVRQYIKLQKTHTESLKLAYDEVEKLAFFDSLTGLPNRRMFKEKMNYAIKMAERSGKFYALFCLDLDNFKRINDSLGHDCGDQLLVTIAERLQNLTRSVDTVAHISGDEFNLLFCDIYSEDRAAKIAANILNRLAESIELDHHEIFVTASIGITILPHDSNDPISLLKYADLALYKAKGLGRNTFQFYDERLNKIATENMALEGKLRNAIANRQFVLHYQPQFDSEAKSIIAYEALVRWLDPDEGLISPLKFIPVAEDTGLIVDIGRWVVEQACQDFKLLQQHVGSKITVAVNISLRQVKDSGFIDELKKAINKAKIKPENIEIELTESLLMEEIDDTKNLLSNFQSMGCSVSVDDFGTGYSSLSYLQKLSFDTLKVDRSFIQNITTDKGDREIVSAIIAMAHNLGLTVVAEGVETEAQLELLKQKSCDIFQGYLLGRPLPISQILTQSEQKISVAK